MKIAAGWFKERRGTALGVLVGAVSLGSAFPHLLAWTAAAVSLAHADARVVAAGARRRRAGRGSRSRTVRTSRRPRRSIRMRSAPWSATAARGSRRSAISVTCGSSTRCGRGSRRLPPPGCTSPASTPSGPDRWWRSSRSRSGAIGCVHRGLWADRWGKARIAGGALVVSGAVLAVRRSALRRRRSWLLFALAVVWGFTRRRRLGAVLGAGHRTQPAHPRRHRADAADVRRVPADDGEHAAAAAARGQLRLAVGVRAAGARARCSAHAMRRMRRLSVSVAPAGAALAPLASLPHAQPQASIELA